MATQIEVYSRTGTEGPRYDPYGFTEYTVTKQNGTVVVIHCGLAMWIKKRLPTGTETKQSEYDFEKFNRMVKKAVGKSLEDLEQIILEREMAKSDEQREMEAIENALWRNCF